MEKYLTILIDSQKKKLEMLDRITEICDRHDECLREEVPDMDEYNELMKQKGSLIEEMNRLDDGFVALYDRIAPALRENPGLYEVRLRELKSLIRQVSNKTALIQAHELRIQTRVDRLASLGTARSKAKPARADAAMRYQRTMNKTGQAQSIFVDTKQKRSKK